MQSSQLQSHIAYTLENTDQLSKLGMKMLQTTQNPYLLHVSTILYNGRTRLLYHTEGMDALSTMTGRLTGQMTVRILNALAEALREVREKAFWENEFVILETDRIYISDSGMTPKFLLLPVIHSATGQMGREWLESLLQLLKLLKSAAGADMNQADLQTLFAQCDRISEMDDLKQMEALQELKKLPEILMDNFTGQEGQQQEQDSGIKTQAETPLLQSEMELRYTGVLGSFAFYISRENFIIGKSPDSDGVISMNPAISRRHCQISRKENGWYLTDLGSSNHTCLNGQLLSAGQEVCLQEQDTVRMADMDFEVRMR